MKDLIILLMHLLATLAKIMGPGGAKAVVADSLLMQQQLLVINRSRLRAPNLSALDRFLLGFWSLFLRRSHILPTDLSNYRWTTLCRGLYQLPIAA